MRIIKTYLFALGFLVVSNVIASNQALAKVGTSHTVVGQPLYQANSTGLVQTEAYFDFPEGITADTAGNLYIADTQNNAIRRIDTTTGLTTTIVGDGRYGDGTRLAHPSGIAVDNNNNIYIADTENNKIKKFSNRILTTIINDVAAPRGIAVQNNTLYFIETATNSLYASDLNGDHKRVITGALQEPNYLVVRSVGDYAYVLNNATCAVVRVHLQTGEITEVATIGHDDFYPTLQGIALVEGNTVSADDLFVMTYSSDSHYSYLMLIDPDISFTYTTTRNNGKPYTNNAVVRTYIILNGSNYSDSLRIVYFNATAPKEIEMNSAMGLAIINDTLFIANTGGSQIYSGEIPNLSNHDYLNPVWSVYAGKNRFQSADGTPGLPGRPKDVILSKDKQTIFFTENNQIKKLSLPDKTITAIVGNVIDNYPVHDEPPASGSEARFSDPSAIALSVDEQWLYVVDRNNNRIRKVDLANQTVYYVTGYGSVNSISSSYTGYHEGRACPSINMTGEEWMAIDWSDCAMFSRPYGIAMDPAGKYIYVSDTGNHVIRSIEISGDAIGRTHLLAGTPQVAGFVDGASTTVQFNVPQGLTIDKAGKNLYVADRDNHAIRAVRISDGVVTTVVGSPDRRGEVDGNFSTASLNLPVELVWKRHRLYFSDASKRLRLLNFHRQRVVGVSGNGKQGYMNGNSQATQFEGILGIAIQGKFAYVSDYQNDAIRRVRVR